MSLSFDPHEADGSPRKYVGMWRPPFEQAQAEWNEREQIYTRGWYRLGDDREAWLRGEFDKPLYEVAER